MKRVGAQGLFSYAVFFLCLSVALFGRAGEWWAAPDWSPTSNDEKAFVQDFPDEHQFLAACRQGRVDVMEYWLSQKGFRPNDEFISGRTGEKVSGLRVASKKGHTDGVKLLIKAGADLNQCSDGGATPLYMASQNGRAEAVEILIQAGADLNQARNDGGTPLYIASEDGHNKVVEILLKAGADLNQGYHGVTPLYISSQNGHSNVVEILLKAGADLNQGYHGATPLFIASQNGHAGVVQILVEATGADLNQDPDDGATPLFMASQSGHVEIVEILVNARANPTLKWHYDLVFTKSPLKAAEHELPLWRKTNPDKYDRYDEVVKILKPAVKTWKEHKKLQAQLAGNTGCFDGFVCALREGIKQTVAPLMMRAPLKSKGY